MLTDATLLDEFVLVSLLFTSVGVIEFAVISWLNTNVFYLFVVLCLIVLLRYIYIYILLLSYNSGFVEQYQNEN